MQSILKINLQNMQYNLQVIKRASGNKQICAMVKADAYGHGIREIANFLNGQVEYFGVATLAEAKQILKLCTKSKILICSPLSAKDINFCVKNKIEIMVDNLSILKFIAENICEQIFVHIKIDCGLNRYGFKNAKEIICALNIIQKNKNIIINGIYTHFSIHKKNKKLIKQHEKFKKNVKIIEKNAKKLNISIKNAKIHCSSSFSFLHFKNDFCNMIRVGLALYGRANIDIDTRQVMSLCSHIISIRNVKQGENVGYDDCFVAKSNMVVGVVGIGYADGIDCRLSNVGYVLINGQKANIVGKICMDCFLVDLTCCKNSMVGDEVEIFYEEKNENNILKKINKSEYEIATSFSSNRIVKKYVNN